MSKVNTTLVLSGTADYAFAIGNVLIGLEKFSPNFIDKVIIYHDGLNSNDKNALLKIRDCVFMDYSARNLAQLPPTTMIQRFSKQSFAIYEIFDLLETSKYVLYLDCDTIIQRDITGILEYAPISMRSFGGSAFLIQALGQNPNNEIPHDLRTKNSGVILVSDELNYKGLSDFCYAKTEEFWNTLHLPDQAILSYMIFKFQLPLNELSHLYNDFHNDSLLRNGVSPCISHAVGTNDKPWNNGVIYERFPHWRNNNDIWLSLGGTPYTGIKFYPEFFNSDFYSKYSVYSLANAFNHFSHSILSIVTSGLENIDNIVIRNHKLAFSISRNISFKVRIHNTFIRVTCYFSNNVMIKKPELFEEYVKQNIFIAKRESKKLISTTSDITLLNQPKEVIEYAVDIIYHITKMREAIAGY